MKVAVLQSNYIPWKGYFDIINDVELFVFYDDVQFTKNDWRNRNKIKTKNGTEWLTIPCRQDIDQKIHEVPTVGKAWQRKHWETIRHHYHDCPGFKKYSDFFHAFYTQEEWPNLSQLNQSLIKKISTDLLGSRVSFGDSRQFALEGSGQERLLSLLQQTGATEYVSGPSGRNYIDQGAFDKANIRLIYKDYDGYPEYPQKYPPFDHFVSIVDVLFNCGEESPSYIWGWRGN